MTSSKVYILNLITWEIKKKKKKISTKIIILNENLLIIKKNKINNTNVVASSIWKTDKKIEIVIVPK